MTIKRTLLNLSTCSCILFSTAAAANADDWSFEIEPFLMFSSINGESSMGRITGAPIDVNFRDLLEDMKLAGMVHFEAVHDSGWGISADYGFMKLGIEQTGPMGGITDVYVRQGVLEALLMKRIKLANGHFDFLAGIRWWDNDISVDVDHDILPGTLTTKINEDWVDLVVGAQLQHNLGERWKFTLRGDIGGLGVQSDFTANVATGIQYQMSDSWALDLQYKATWVDYKNNVKVGEPGYFSYDTVSHGPLIGFIYSF